MPGRRAVALLVAVALSFAAAPPGRTGVPLDPESTRDARDGLEHLYHGRADEAARAFERIRDRHPQSPAPDFLLGGIEWHALITGPSGFVGGGPHEAAFFERLDASVAKGEALVERDPNDLSARFFLGGAYGYRARYLAMKEKWWEAYRTGRKGLKHLEAVVDRDPTFADAYLGLGIYHYYADVLPATLRIFAGLVGMRGDRARGIEELRFALREGSLVDQEARFFLAEVHTTFEENHWTGYGFSRSLRDEYPENELFTWLHARILDELHLTEEAEREWRHLREIAEGRRMTGFLDYRLARTRLFGGDFAGAEQILDTALLYGRLGSRRISMWGRLRRGQALDFLGRHEEAIEQYRIARDLDASGTAKERADERLDAGRRDASTISLSELAETARIVKETGAHDEAALDRLEAWTTGPSRGLDREGKSRYFAILGDLAEARLRRGDPAGCLAALERALRGNPKPPKEQRGDLLARKARVLARTGRREEAIATWNRAIARAGGERRTTLEIERDSYAAAPARPGASPPPGAETLEIVTPDRGEVRLEVEWREGAATRRAEAVRDDRIWRARLPAAEPDRPVRWRFVTDGHRPRIDPIAARAVAVGDVIWGEGVRAGAPSPSGTSGRAAPTPDR